MDTTHKLSKVAQHILGPKTKNSPYMLITKGPLVTRNKLANIGYFFKYYAVMAFSEICIMLTKATFYAGKGRPVVTRMPNFLYRWWTHELGQGCYSPLLLRKTVRPEELEETYEHFSRTITHYLKDFGIVGHNGVREYEPCDGLIEVTLSVYLQSYAVRLLRESMMKDPYSYLYPFFVREEEPKASKPKRPKTTKASKTAKKRAIVKKEADKERKRTKRKRK